MLSPKRLTALIILTSTIVLVVVILIFNTTGYQVLNSQPTPTPTEPNYHTYIALGDSYTIGIGIDLQGSWPVQLTKSLQENGFELNLIGVIAQNGWTTQDILETALPQIQSISPDYISLQIGVNDWINQVNIAVFQQRVSAIFDELEKKVSSPSQIIIMTIPDFSAAPNGYVYASGRDIPSGITDFNNILTTEAERRDFTIIDIFDLSQEMRQNPELVASDKLHPSEKAYTQWVEFIKPTFEALLTT